MLRFGPLVIILAALAPPETAADGLAQAREARAQGAFELAAERLEGLLATDAKDLNARRELADLCLGLGWLERADKLLAGNHDPEAEIPLKPLRERLRRLSAELPAREGPLKAAIAEHPDRLATRIELGRLYLELDLPEAAWIAFARARELEPEAPDALLGLGQAAAARGLAREACALLEQAAALAPGRADVQAELGIFLLALEPPQAQRAAEALGRAIQLDPEDGIALAMHGRALGLLKRQPEAARSLRAALAILPADAPPAREARYLLALALDAQDNRDQARPLLEALASGAEPVDEWAQMARETLKTWSQR